MPKYTAYQPFCFSGNRTSGASTYEAAPNIVPVTLFVAKGINRHFLAADLVDNATAGSQRDISERIITPALFSAAGNTAVLHKQPNNNPLTTVPIFTSDSFFQKSILYSIFDAVIENSQSYFAHKMSRDDVTRLALGRGRKELRFDLFVLDNHEADCYLGNQSKSALLQIGLRISKNPMPQPRKKKRRITYVCLCVSLFSKPACSVSHEIWFCFSPSICVTF